MKLLNLLSICLFSLTLVACGGDSSSYDYSSDGTQSSEELLDELGKVDTILLHEDLSPVAFLESALIGVFKDNNMKPDSGWQMLESATGEYKNNYFDENQYDFNFEALTDIDYFSYGLHGKLSIKDRFGHVAAVDFQEEFIVFTQDGYTGYISRVEYQARYLPIFLLKAK